MLFCVTVKCNSQTRCNEKKSLEVVKPLFFTHLLYYYYYIDFEEVRKIQKYRNKKIYEEKKKCSWLAGCRDIYSSIRSPNIVWNRLYEVNNSYCSKIGAKLS